MPSPCSWIYLEMTRTQIWVNRFPIWPRIYDNLSIISTFSILSLYPYFAYHIRRFANLDSTAFFHSYQIFTMLRFSLIITLFSTSIAATGLLNTRHDDRSSGYTKNDWSCGWLFTTMSVFGTDHSSYYQFDTFPNNTIIANDTCFPLPKAISGLFYLDPSVCQCCFYKLVFLFRTVNCNWFFRTDKFLSSSRKDRCADTTDADRGQMDPLTLEGSGTRIVGWMNFSQLNISWARCYSLPRVDPTCEGGYPYTS
jgi:hypothetical protein